MILQDYVFVSNDVSVDRKSTKLRVVIVPTSTSSTSLRLTTLFKLFCWSLDSSLLVVVPLIVIFLPHLIDLAVHPCAPPTLGVAPMVPALLVLVYSLNIKESSSPKPLLLSLPTHSLVLSLIASTVKQWA